MNRIGYITAILLAVLLCGSCINEEYAGPDPDLPTRTIIVYLGGDNNLSEETGRKIEALLGYNPSTAGGLMSVEFLALAATDSVAEGIARVRSSRIAPDSGMTNLNGYTGSGSALKVCSRIASDSCA